MTSSLTLSFHSKYQNVLQVNAYIQTFPTISSELIENCMPTRLDEKVIQINYKELKTLFCPEKYKSIPFCLYNIPIWQKHGEFFYTKLIINKSTIFVIVRACRLDFIQFHETSLFTDYNMGIYIDKNLNIVRYEYIKEHNPIDIHF